MIIYMWLLHGHLPSYVVIYLVITGLFTWHHIVIYLITVTYRIITWLSHGYLHYHMVIYLIIIFSVY